MAGVYRSLRWVYIIIITLLIVVPIFYVLSASFMPPSELQEITQQEDELQGAALFLPRYFTILQYKSLFSEDPEYFFRILFSMGIAVPIVLGVVLIAPLAAFGFALWHSRLRNVVLILYIMLSILPCQVMLVPNYIVYDRLGLVGSYAAVWLGAAFHPFCVYFIYRYMRGMHVEIIESARIDGANWLQLYIHMVLPSAKPAIAAAALLSCVDAWSMIEQPLIFIGEQSRYPMSVVLSGVDPTRAFAAAVVFVVPIALLYLYLRDDLQRSIGDVAGKGIF